jgi:hypothetical protein
MIATSSYAGNLNLKYGLPVLHAQGNGAFGSIGYQHSIFRALNQQIETGLWTSRVRESGQKTSPFASYSLGVKVDLDYVYAESMHGIGLIGQPDVLLGGPGQFFHDTGLGIKDRDGSSFGLQWKHVSSAGAYKPNIGRDFVLIKVGLAL